MAPSTCSKILERPAHKQLINCLEINDPLSKTQFGYKKNRSIELAMILLFDNMRKAVHEGHIVGLFYVNLPETFAVDEFRIVGVLHVKLSKAFDTLSHSSLLEKLKSFGIKVSDDSHT